MKIIFLDIDGVLNSRAYDKKRNPEERTNIDETRLPLLKEIVDASGAKIVLASTWRAHWDRQERLCDGDGRYIADVFQKYGLQIFDKTPDFGAHASRKEEIVRWLDGAEGVTSYVILDDCRFGWGELSDRFVKTDPNFHFGLEREQAERAIEILNGGDGK